MFFKQSKEEILMRQVAKGDEKAFRQLALKYQKPLYSFCSKFMNGQNAYLDDVVQQVLISWWQNAPQWSPFKGRLRAWVFTIAANKCRDYLKRPIFKNETLKDDSAHFEIFVEDGLQNTYQNSALLEAMKSLTAKQKEIIWLVYFEELKHKEVAMQLNTTVKSVESSLGRSRCKLKILLQKEKGDLL